VAETAIVRRDVDLGRALRDEEIEEEIKGISGFFPRGRLAQAFVASSIVPSGCT